MKKYGLLIGVIILLLMSLAYLIMAINPVGLNEFRLSSSDKKSKLLVSQKKIDKPFKNKNKIVEKEKKDKKALLLENNEVEQKDDQIERLFLEFKKLKKDVSLFAEDFYLKEGKESEGYLYPSFLTENQEKYIKNDSLNVAVKSLYLEIESLRDFLESIKSKQNSQSKNLEKISSRLSEYDSIVKNNMRYIMLMQIEQDSLFRAKGLKDSI
ncbi:MAG: hypothetical protein WC164_02410 [Patescibacteria group bacterium]|jgi:hypothetical protein|nr:hypothetical protein [Patescibacteria group bacterium]